MREETGADEVKTVVHCQGSTSFMLSLVSGLLPEVTTVVSNAVSLHPVVPSKAALKGRLAVPHVRRMVDYGVYRETTETGHECAVVAPSLIPRKPGDRVKTDRRDALALARLHRSGDLASVWVPGPEQEAMRNLTRAREDIKGLELKACQRLGAFLLRHERVYTAGRSRWTQAHFRWLEAQRFEQPVHQVVFQECIDAVTQAQARVTKSSIRPA